MDLKTSWASSGMSGKTIRGEMLIDFCRDNELFIMNTMFRHRERRKVTWRSPDGRTANMIGYILLSKRLKSSVLNTVSIAGGDFDSDHVLVMSELCLRIRKPQQLKKSLPRHRVDLLKNIEQGTGIDQHSQTSCQESNPWKLQQHKKLTDWSTKAHPS
ncbi:hypothetical protein QYM36_018549 [Artemia franciscana]|uniref:Uncharacterized protein n=1 Tax=Artemia franciscana TaxID=6661 RepID=A0AA88H3T7_ARTSF|nr:hypothetical protein QYM36_018549 [Artemia franciscana]